MSKNLVIVESPAKAKTIEKYLGKDFGVLASYGHVRDLVPKGGAVDPENDFAMRYQIIERNEKHVNAIIRALKKADALYLATDPDREGEAISWHLFELLKEKTHWATSRCIASCSTRLRSLPYRKRSPTRGICPTTWWTRSRRDAHWTTLSVLIYRRCSGKRCSVACRQAGYKARRCG